MIRTEILTKDNFKDVINFNCNNHSFNNFLKDEGQALYFNAAMLSSTSLVYENDIMIGFFCLKREYLKIDGAGEKEYPSIEISKIAVDARFQRKGYGDHILDYIIKMALQFNERYISLDSLSYIKKWYRNRGFEPLIEREYKSYSQNGLVQMYLDLYNEEYEDTFFPKY